MRCFKSRSFSYNLITGLMSMKKKLRMIAGGVALITAFAGAAYMPSVSWIRGIGTGLLRQTLIFFREPVKDRDLMGELLGGQSYFQCVEEKPVI